MSSSHSSTALVTTQKTLVAPSHCVFVAAAAHNSLTRKESARPWLEPAFEQTAEAQVQAFADSLRASIEESVKG